ncbi:TPA: ead/Ea22-like family protein [Escherichia coli]|nr:ead/Ea22-like family protein [Escherichia coli]EFO0468948.1 ead/Ea22-like family protein [Escherichia coli]HBN1753859.1 ead/Ea22-like family protein [Escherichia coli]HBN2266599.1 ead/Ea22-like family protein [Escherichia coli]
MSKINYQALREAAEQAMHDDWGFDADLFHELVTPSIVLTLLDERERNQQYIKRRDQENEDIALTVGKLRVELEAAEKRIAELEAREISLPERSSMLHRTDFHDDYQTVMAYKVSEVIAAIRAAGIRIKGE